MSRILLLLLTVPCALPVSAQEGPTWWGGSYETGLDQARRRNVPVLIAFIQDGEEANDRVVKNLFPRSEFIELCREVVPLIANKDQHEEVAREVDGRKITVCEKFGSVPCSRHREFERHARRAYWVENVVKTPSVVVALPDGSEVDRLIDVHPPGAYEDLVGRAQRKLGKGLARKEYEKLQKDLRRTRFLLGKDDLDAAADLLGGTRDKTRGHPMEEEVDRLEDRLERAARGRLDEAARLWEAGEHVRALYLLQRGAAAFEGLEVGAAYAARLEELAGTSEGRKAERALARMERLRPRFEKARGYEREGDYARAARSYHRIMVRAEETPLAEEAEARLEALRKDPEIGKVVEPVVRGLESLRLYRRALVLHRRGQDEEARALLKRIVKEYEGTTSARKAAERLKEDGD